MNNTEKSISKTESTFIDSFKEKFEFKCRKFVIKLKRNFYIIPLIFIVFSTMFFMCTLYISSSVVLRIPESVSSYARLLGMLLFIVTLSGILSSVAYLNFAYSKNKNKAWPMLAIFYVLSIVNVVIMFLLIDCNHINLVNEIENYNNAIASGNTGCIDILNKYVNLEKQTAIVFIAYLVFNFVSMVLVAVSPLIQNAIRKIKFKSISNTGENE